MLFEDLRSNEYFPPCFLVVERILDVNDDKIDIGSIDWEAAVLPPDNILLANAEESPVVNNMKNTDGKSSIYLHSSKCFVTVKWESLPYTSVTFENIQDLRIRGIEYESQLKDFYKREQMKPVQLAKIGLTKRKNNKLINAQVTEATFVKYAYVSSLFRMNFFIIFHDIFVLFRRSFAMGIPPYYPAKASFETTSGRACAGCSSTGPKTETLS